MEVGRRQLGLKDAWLETASNRILMNLAMLPAEQSLLESFLCCSKSYLEFGAGGSTHLACGLVADRITSIDSSRAWLDIVKSACELGSLQPRLVLADVGPVGDWGYPIEASSRDLWPSYSQSIWQYPESADTDFCLVDGRFRVACALSCLLRSPRKTLLAVHDYAIREKYHVVSKYADEIARTQNLSVFRRKCNVPDRAIKAELSDWLFDPD